MNAFSYTQRFSARILAAVALFSLIASLFPLQTYAQVATDLVAVETVSFCHVPEGNSAEAEIFTDQPLVSWEDGHVQHADDFLITSQTDADACLALQVPDTTTLSVDKVLVNAPEGVTADDFTFSVQGIDVGFEADGSNDVNVQTGAYDVTEKGETSGSLEMDGNTYSVSYSDSCDGTLAVEGNHVTCTITNTFCPFGVDNEGACMGGGVCPPGSLGSNYPFCDGEQTVISVNKVLVNAPEGVTADDFTFSVQGIDVGFEADGSNDVNVQTGAFDVTEQGETSGTVTVGGNTYDVSYSDSCDGTVAVDTDHVTCTITNTFVSSDNNPPVVDTCVLPDANGGTDDINFGETYDPSGTELQDVLNDYGYGDVNAETDVLDTQVWNFASSDTGSTTFNVKVLAKISQNNELFGYYYENDPGSFVPLFRAGAHSDASVPMVAVGSTIQVTIPNNASFGFAIDSEGENSNTWYSQPGLNDDGVDNVAVYNPKDDTYIVAFEDLRQEDNDYQDLVLQLTRVACIPRDNGGGQVAGDYVSVCPAPNTNLLTNGSFEDPVVSAGNGTALGGGFFGIFSSITGWMASNSIELWNNLFGGASQGAQNTELDVSGSSALTQTITTVPGATYELRFDFAAREGTDAANNSVLASVNGNSLLTTSTSSTQWTTYGDTFVATGTSTDITLADAGTSNGEGTLVDNAVVCLVQPSPTVNQCSDGVDNDGDGLIDFGTSTSSDPGCASADDNDESNAVACTVNVFGDSSTSVNASGAIVVEDQPSAWVDNIVGSLAQWIWSAVSGSAIDPVNDETQTFTKTFEWNGTTTDAILKISADNMYSVSLNGTEIASSTDGDNFTSTDVIDVNNALVLQGTNTLVFTVTNDANGATSTATTTNGNPAGLLYDFTVTGDTTSDCSPSDGGGGGGNNDTLSCTLTANDTTIRRGRDVELTFTSNDATSATLTDDNGDINDEGAVALSGSTMIEDVRDDTTFTLTVSDGTSTSTCSEFVNTSSGGGGGGTRTSGRVLGESTDNSNDNNDDDSNDDNDDNGSGQVLGEQVSLIPTGAPNAGAGGTSPLTLGFSLTPVAFLRRNQLKR